MGNSYIIQYFMEDNIHEIDIHTFPVTFKEGFIKTGYWGDTYQLTDYKGLTAWLDNFKAQNMDGHTIVGHWYAHNDPVKAKKIVEQLTTYFNNPESVADENLCFYADEVITENLTYLSDWTIESSMKLTATGLEREARFVKLPIWTHMVL